MTISISTTETDVDTTLGNFLVAILPAGTEVIKGQPNRVPEPAGADFVVMTTIRRQRLSTNVDGKTDAAFVGSIAGPTMTITSVIRGALAVGSPVFGVSVADNTSVTSLGTGIGGIGTYVVSPAQTVGSETLSAGTRSATQATRVAVQLDVHGPNSADNAQVIATLMRDEFAVREFAQSNPGVVPLYADEPRQIPFLNGEQQIETRWIVDVHIQVNPVVSGMPQQFADAVALGVVSVQATYPP